MARLLHRGISGLPNSGNINDYWDSEIKEWSDKENSDKTRQSSDNHSYFSLKFPISLLEKSSSNNDSNEDGYASKQHLFDDVNSRSRHKIFMLLLKLSLVVAVIFSLAGSFWWAISISSSPRVQISHNYRRLSERIVSDFSDIDKFSLGSARLKDLEFCSKEYENYVPCFDVTENLALGFTNGNEYDRHCELGTRKNCLVLPPVKYRIPLKWPTGRDVIWVANVKITAQEVLSSGSLTKRMMMLEEEQISFRSASLMFDGVEDYSHQIAEMIGLRNESNFIQAGVRTILDIGCGFGSFGAHLNSKQVLTMCIASYEPTGSQVQLTLERGLPAMIGTFTSKQLPYSTFSFDMLHCARCGVDWAEKDGSLLIEADRVLRPGGYFVWTSPITNVQGSIHNKLNREKWSFVGNFVESLCWDLFSQQDKTVIWKKNSNKNCYKSRKSGDVPSICNKGQNVESPYYRPLQSCIGGIHSRRWIPIEQRTTWPFRAHLNSTELTNYGVYSKEFAEDTANWKAAVSNYWSLLSPIIFSDHPKKPGDEDPSPPFNMIRNVLDMNAHFGGFGSALVEAGKSVWVMNVVPANRPNYLPLIVDRGFVGVLHDWCEPFPTYPRTYDMVHAEGLLSLLQADQKRRCTTLDLFTEIDRILRPEGWVIFRDAAPLIESVRTLIIRLKWDARVIEIESFRDERLLICQKSFFKKQSS